MTSALGKCIFIHAIYGPDLGTLWKPLSLAPLATDQPWTTQRDFHLARRKPFDPSGVALLCKAGTQHADFIWVLGDTSSALRADLWVLLYCLREFNLLVNQTGLFLMFLTPTVLTITQQRLCCCFTLTFVLLHLWSWALQPNPQRPAFASHVASIRDRMSPLKTTANSFTDCLDPQTGFPPSLYVSCL